MAEHPNVDLLRRGYDAFAKGDFETLKDLFADDIVWHSGGHNQLTGDYRGHDAVFGLFGRLMELTEGTYTNELHDVLANDEHGVALVIARTTRGGNAMEVNEVHVFHLRDGKVTEFWIASTDEQVSDAMIG